jgi:hypothetical protein
VIRIFKVNFSLLLSLQALQSLAENKQRMLLSIAIRFVGQNPLFYAGQEFVNALKYLFECHNYEKEEDEAENKSNKVCILTIIRLH